MITQRVATLATFAGVFLMVGVGLGNGVLLVVGLTLGGILAWGLSIEPPADTQGRIETDRRHPRIGDIVTIRLRYRVDSGVGPVLVHVPLPPTMQLVSGSNIGIAWKGRRPLLAAIAFQVRCGARGGSHVGPAKASGIHPLRFMAGADQEVAPALLIEVAPRVRTITRVRHLRGRARTRLSGGDQARAGERATDFHELRDYVVGDPLRSVNWRATARRSTETLRLTVNEHEQEGKKAVWLFIDGGAHMELGSARENSLDKVLEGALGLVDHFVKRGHRVGATIYHQPRTEVVYADHGNRQTMRLAGHLTGLAAHPGGEGLDRAVLRTRGFLVRERPLVLLVTRPEADAAATQAGIDRLRGLLANGRRPPQILLLAPAPIQHALEGGHHPLTVHTMDRLARATYLRLRRQGVRVIDWDPARQPLGAMLVREVTRA